MAKKLALGKGIASLIQAPHNEIVTQTLKNNFAEQEKSSHSFTGTMFVDINKIAVNSVQPRKIFKEKELEELAVSIKENGIIQPLIVTKTDNGFELIAGERRLRASKKAGLKQVPVVIKQVTDREKLVMAII